MYLIQQCSRGFVVPSEHLGGLCGNMVCCSECREASLAGNLGFYPECSDSYASFAAPSASSRSSPMTPGLASLSTIPIAPAIATIMTLTWGLTEMVALAVSTATAGTQPVSGSPLMASCGAGARARAASRTGATPAPSCAATLSCRLQPPPSPCLLPGPS